MAGAGLEGFGQGLGQGLDIVSRMRAMQQMQDEQQRQQQARAAAGRMLMAPPMPGAEPPPMGGGGMPQPPMPGEASMPAGGPPTLAAPPPMGGTPQIPSGGAPPLPPPMGAMNFPMPPDPGPAPAAAAAPAPMGAGGDPLTGAAAPGGNVVTSAQDTIRAIAQQIKDASPGISPEALYDATSLHIEQMKGVRNDVKDYMQQQIELAKIQTRLAQTEQRIQGNIDVATIAADSRRDVAVERGKASRDVAGTQAGARRDSASIGAGSRERVAGTNAGARVDSARIGADARVEASANDADARMYGADQGYRRGVDSASALTKPVAPTKPVAKPKIARPSSAGKSNRGNSYTPDSLKAAVSSGTLTRQQGEKIARDNGWIR